MQETQPAIAELKTSTDPAAKKSTRIKNSPPDNFDPNQPRLGRRESEPHSYEVANLCDVLRQNFPKDRTLWDLHHYFMIDGEKVDVQFDLSYFRDFQIDNALSSYDASKYGNRLPTMALNFLSKNTWRSDFSGILEVTQVLGISAYVVFAPDHSATKIFKPPFLRVYFKDNNGHFTYSDLRNYTMKEGESFPTANYDDKILDTSHLGPFRLGIVKRKQKYKDGLPIYHLIFIHATEPRTLLTFGEFHKQDAEKAKQEAEKAKQEAEKAKQEAEVAKRETGEAKLETENAKLETEKARLDAEKAMLKADELQEMLDRLQSGF